MEKNPEPPRPPKAPGGTKAPGSTAPVYLLVDELEQRGADEEVCRVARAPGGRAHEGGSSPDGRQGAQGRILGELAPGPDERVPGQGRGHGERGRERRGPSMSKMDVTL